MLVLLWDKEWQSQFTFQSGFENAVFDAKLAGGEWQRECHAG